MMSCCDTVGTITCNVLLQASHIGFVVPASVDALDLLADGGV